MKVNDIVKFKDETEEEKAARLEGRVRMVVLSVDSPRCTVEEQIGWMYNPVKVYEIQDFEVIGSI